MLEIFCDGFKWIPPPELTGPGGKWSIPLLQPHHQKRAHSFFLNFLSLLDPEGLCHPLSSNLLLANFIIKSINWGEIPLFIPLILLIVPLFLFIWYFDYYLTGRISVLVHSISCSVNFMYFYGHLLLD